MALVTLKKSYEFEVNQVLDGVGQTNYTQPAYVLWKIKDTLINYTNSPWTVVLSSDSVSAGAADYWVDYGDVVWHSGTNPHSWIVLERVDGGQLLIECLSTASTRPDIMTAKWSNEGLFTGGTVNTAPTALDSQDMLNVQPWRDIWYTTDVHYLHMIHSTDGEIDHIIVTYDGVPFLYWGFQVVGCPVPNYDLNNIAFGYTNDVRTSSRCTYSIHERQQYWIAKKAKTGDGTGIFRCGLTCLVAQNPAYAVGETVRYNVPLNDLCTLFPIGVMSLSAGFEGRHGVLWDQWFSPTGFGAGMTFEENPLSPTYELATFAHFVLPWNGTVPVVS